MIQIAVAGLGPGEQVCFGQALSSLVEQARVVVFRTEVHPGAGAARDLITRLNPSVQIINFDGLYQDASSFEQLYSEMAQVLTDLAQNAGLVLYLVPGSPMVAERSVDYLRERMPPQDLHIIPGVSFLELVWVALGTDPLEAGVTIVDAADFPSLAKTHSGPFLLTQVWSKTILSQVKLSLEEPLDAVAIVLQRLGTSEQNVFEVSWDEMDRAVDPDHLTSLYIPKIPASPGPALVRLYDVIGRLRTDCPWDREQTHSSLVRHLIEECYEVVDVIEKLETSRDAQESEKLFADLKGELGDLLVQAYFHANLASEEGHFDIGSVAEWVTEKLVRRHPHVFGDFSVKSADQVADNWEKIKHSEEGRVSILDGIAESMPALLLAPKLLRKATAVGIDIPERSALLPRLAEAFDRLVGKVETNSSDIESSFGELLWGLVQLSKVTGTDLEAALRSQVKRFMATMAEAENAKA